MTGCALAALGMFGQSAGAAPKPNILLIITDQQQANDMSCTGNPWVKTPNLDRLAAGGIRFERAYAANPVCIPSRFSMFTGTMPSAIGMEDNADEKKVFVPTNILRQSMGTIFCAAGYHTVYAGKVHLPGQSGVCGNVAAYGFEEHLVPHDFEGRTPTVNACVNFIETNHTDKPFLLVASLINPHDICYLPLRDELKATKSSKKLPPLDLKNVDEAMKLPPGVSQEEFYSKLCPPLPENFKIPARELTAYMADQYDNYLGWARRNYNDNQWRMYRWVYARLTEHVDGQIGRILDALRNAGLDENTVVIFLSDHGDQDGAHHLATKGYLYEESTHVPFLVKWEGVIKPGQVDTNHLVSTGLDLIPTLCDFAGVPIPTALKGRSVRPLAEGLAVKDWRTYLVEENNSARLVRFGIWKYMVGNADTVTPAVVEKLSLYHPVYPVWESLVDLKTDPGEMNNLATDPVFQVQLQKGRRLLQEWYASHDLKLYPQYVVEKWY